MINVLPSPSVLIKNEIDTLERLRNFPAINNHYSMLSYQANKEYAYYEANTNRNSFSFQASFEIEIDGIHRKVFVGARITTDNKHTAYEELTYYFAICKDSSGNCLLKKMHFDYANPHLKSNKPHPIFHLQFPGKLTKFLEDLSIKDDHLFPNFSEPRIPFYPMTLALLINLIFKESESDNSRKVINQHEWRNLIKKNEELVLNPYYEKCFDFISKRNKGRIGAAKYLLNDLYYGVSN